MRDPQYLKALRHEAETGHPEACFGLASLLGEEASEALLKLANSAEPKVAKAAAYGLLARLPVPGDGWLRLLDPDRSPTVRQAWPARLDAPLLEFATKALHSHPRPEVPAGSPDLLADGYFRLSEANIFSPAATIVAARGGPSHAAAILAATQWTLAFPITPRTGGNDLREPLAALIEAIDTLRHNGWTIQRTRDLSTVEALKGSAGLLAFFRQLADPKVPKPKDDEWPHIVLENVSLGGDIVIHENALRAIPQPMTEEWEAPVAAALEDPDWGVIVAACRAAGASGRKSLVRPLAEVVESVHDRGVRDAATEAATALGGSLVFWEAWANLLPDNDEIADAIYHLCIGTIDLSNSGSWGTANGQANRSQRFLMRDAWREFLAQHRALLDRGQRVPRNDPSITPILTGWSFGDTPIISIHLQDGTDWPKADVWSGKTSVPGLPPAE